MAKKTETFVAFRILAEYPTAKAALTEQFKLFPEEADDLINSARKRNCTDFTFQNPLLPRGIFGVSLIRKTGKWAAIVGDATAIFSTPEAVKAWTVQRAKELKEDPASIRWVILRNQSSSTTTTTLH
jgi:hypothetical protein